MPHQLEELLTRLKGERALFLSGEEATRQGAVLPILARLGWDRDNIREVVPEYTVAQGRVDYCLKIGEQVCVFIEVKRTNEDLDKHQEQLLEYAFRQGVRIAVLTNGLLWWFYLPLFPGSWDQRKFFAIDIQEQEIGTAATHFMLFLSRDAIASGAAFTKAEEIHAGREKERRIRETIPIAWHDLRQRADEMLIELLVEKVESLCGHRPADDLVAQFLVGDVEPVLSPQKAQPRRSIVEKAQRPAGEPLSPGASENDWTFKTPTGFRFKDKSYRVSTFKEILMTLSEVLYQEHTRDFPKVFQLRGRRRPYFAQDDKGMTLPRQIPGTPVYVETNLSANGVRDRCNDLLALFGYGTHDLQIEFRQSATGR